MSYHSVSKKRQRKRSVSEFSGREMSSMTHEIFLYENHENSLYIIKCLNLKSFTTDKREQPSTSFQVPRDTFFFSIHWR